MRAAFALSAFLCACAAEPDVATRGSALSDGTGDPPQGTRMQGTRMQGTRMQGTRMQGTRMQGTRMQGTRLDGTAFSARALVQPEWDASLLACSSPSSDPLRACGWELAGIGTCKSGSLVTVAASAACSLGSCAGDSMLRICRDRAACAPGSNDELASNDDACGGRCSSVTFRCPGSGAYTALMANRSSDDRSAIEPAASDGVFPLTYPVSGLDFIGATMVGLDASGAEMEILVADIVPDPQDPSGEVLLYTLMAPDPDTGALANLCEADVDGIAAAVPMAGFWDESGARHDSSDVFSFGCTTGVLAKCLRWGYRPWKTVNGYALASVHQACTRMARADYCGDGVPHTHDGTLIDAYDVVPILTRTGVPGMLYEASWTGDGAYCVSKARWDLDGATLLAECPARVALPSLADLLAGCYVKLTRAGRSAILTGNDSYISLSSH